MVIINLSKSKAAQRQMDTAIRMLFSNEDPVAIHTLSMAAFKILRDLATKRGGCNIDELIRKTIKLDKEKDFWKIVHGLSNFLKHADRDPESVFDNVDEEVNDFILFLSCRYYINLGYKLTPEMMALSFWISILYPDLLDILDKSNINDPSVFINFIYQERANLINKTREERITFGKMILEISYEHFTIL